VRIFGYKGLPFSGRHNLLRRSSRSSLHNGKELIIFSQSGRCKRGFKSVVDTVQVLVYCIIQQKSHESQERQRNVVVIKMHIVGNHPAPAHDHAQNRNENPAKELCRSVMI
jgi:hypothetical protein